MGSVGLEKVSFKEGDSVWAKYFSALRGTEVYGLRRFPSPSQYHAQLAAILMLPDGPVEERLYAIAQRDWHVRGQTGCMFARLAALDAARLRWDHLMLTMSPERLDHDTIVELGACVDDAINDKATEIFSLLIPAVRSATQAVEVIRGLASDSQFWLERDEIAGAWLRLHLRYPIGQTGVQAWVMAFAPFDFVPHTRRGPYFELAIRVKEKPPWLFHRLNQDRNVAHLADAPLSMKDKYWEDRWASTYRRTRMILGGEPNDISAAKATIAIPTSLIRQSTEAGEAPAPGGVLR